MSRRILARSRPVRHYLLPTVLLLGFALCPQAFGAPTQRQIGEAILLAKAIVGWLNQGDARRVTREFAPAAKEWLPQETLEQTWQTLNQRLGGLRGITGVTSQAQGDALVVTVVCDFPQSPVRMAIGFDTQQQITRLQFSLASETQQRISEPPQPSLISIPPIETKQWATSR